MGYVVDRAGAVRADDVVAILSVRQHGARSRLLLLDGSLFQTPTRARTVRRALEGAHGNGYWLIARKEQ